MLLQYISNAKESLTALWKKKQPDTIFITLDRIVFKNSLAGPRQLSISTLSCHHILDPTDNHQHHCLTQIPKMSSKTIKAKRPNSSSSTQLTQADVILDFVIPGFVGGESHITVRGTFSHIERFQADILYAKKISIQHSHSPFDSAFHALRYAVIDVFDLKAPYPEFLEANQLKIMWEESAWGPERGSVVIDERKHLNEEELQKLVAHISSKLGRRIYLGVKDGSPYPTPITIYDSTSTSTITTELGKKNQQKDKTPVVWLCKAMTQYFSGPRLEVIGREFFWEEYRLAASQEAKISYSFFFDYWRSMY